MSSPSRSAGPLLRALLAFVAVTALAAIGRAAIGASLQMQLGNPSSAAADPANHAHYLIQRDQYALDYDDGAREPNWAAWDLTTADVGSSGRSSFIQDTTLPDGFYQVLTTDYSGSGYDRGHMCPSADRTVTVADNQQVFYMSNMVPQTPDNNQGVWASFETYCRSLASAGNEVLLICGPSGFGGSTIASGVAIPGYTWKIAVVVPLGSGSALSRVTSSTRVITIKVPNIAGVRSTPWQNFVTSVAQIEADTGYTFFTALPNSIASALRVEVDGQSSAGAPAIVAQPTNQTTVVGGTASFSVTATGDAPLSYQWLKDDVEIPGATDATLAVSPVQASDAGAYDVVVTNSVGSVTSNSASLIITGLAPSIVTSPASQTVAAGTTVTFAVGVTGSPTLTYQWRKDGASLSGATNTTLTLANVQAGDSAAYDVIVTNSVGSATSAAAVLTVNPAAPTIASQPAAQSTALGSNASFTVGAVGSNPLSYQWRKAGTPLIDGGVISGATTATLTLTGVSAIDATSYDVVVTNGLGSATSNAATLTVSAPPPAAITWNFNTASPSSNATTDVTASDVTQNNNNGTTTMLTASSVSSGYTGASGGNNAGTAARTGALNKAAGGSAYFELTLTPTPGKRLIVSGIKFGSRSTSTGPLAYSIFTSVDNYATALATGTLSNNAAWALQNPSFTSLTGATDTPVTFRLYGYNGGGSASAGTANWRIDDLVMTASTVFPPPTAPVVTSTTPANGAPSVDVTAPITITFNEAVTFTGSWFSINSAANGATAAAVTGGPTTFTLSPPTGLSYGDTVTVTVHTAQVVDQATATIHGSGDTTFSFTTAVYVPPTPPTVTTQPTSQTVIAGNSATFSAAASGTAPLTYQWRKNGSPISGNASAATATLTLAGVTTNDAANYDCVVSNVAGSDVSAAASLTVIVLPPTIATQPTAQMVSYGGNASFSVAATGTAPFTYQWRKNGIPLMNGGSVAGATGSTLTVTGVSVSDLGAYDVLVSNAAATVASNSAALSVVDVTSAIYWDFGTAAPTSGLPANVTGGTVTQGNNNGTTTLLTTTSASGSYAGASGGNNAGAAARIGALNQAAGGSAYFEFTFTPASGRQFAASAISFGMRSTGTGPQAFALFSNVDNFAAPIASGTVPNDSAWHLYTPTFKGVVGAVGAPVTFRLFGCNGAGSPGTGTANWRIDDVKLTAGVIVVAPTVVTSPTSQTAIVGDTVNFAVVASGTAPLTYQWRKSGSPITGATDATFQLANITTADAADYDVVVSNALGSDTSGSATLTVNKATATVTLSSLTATYTGASQGISFSTEPAGLAVHLTYDGNSGAPVNAGSYAIVATVDDPNYLGSASGTLTIAPAAANVALGGLTQVYNGSSKPVTVTTSPAGLNVSVTYDNGPAAPTNAGAYSVVATIVDPNYIGTATGVLTIERAIASVAIGDLTQTYDGSPEAVLVETIPAGLTLTVTYNGSTTAPTNAGSYGVAAIVDVPNYIGSATATLTIAQASASIALSDLFQVYDGQPKPVVATTTPSGLSVTITYDGNTAAPIDPGAYAVIATITDPNYQASASATLNINTTAFVRHASILDGGVDGSVQVTTGENITLNGASWISGDLLVPGTPSVRFNGLPMLASVMDSTGDAAPSNYVVTLNGNAVLRTLVRRTDARPLPTVAIPAAPEGTRSVTMNSSADTIGDFATVRDLTLNGNAGAVVIPAGAYGSLIANAKSTFVLGVVGATEPAVYNVQSLVLNANSTLRVVGPVILNLANGAAWSGNAGDASVPEWLTLNIASGGLALNGNVVVCGYITAPRGTVTINSNSTLNGVVVADRLVVNANGVLRQP